MLGLVWTPEDLEVLAKQAEGQKNMTAAELENARPVADEAPRSRALRYPLSLLVRPELLKNLQEHAIPSDGGLFGMHHVPKDAMSLYGSSKEEFLRRMGATAVAQPQDEFERSQVDPFARSQRPVGGFTEGRSRPLGGGGRRR